MKRGEPLVIVAVYLRGDRLCPSKLSSELGIQASHAQKKGDVIQGVKPVTAEIGLWALSAQTKSVNISEHVDELLQKFQSVKRPLHRLDAVEEAYLDIFIAQDNETTDRNSIEAILSLEQVAKIGKLGLAVHLTVS